MLFSIAISLILICIIIYGLYYLFIVRKESAMGIEERHLRAHWKELKRRKYKVIALMLQGSQNYGLEEYSLDYCSDIDSKAIVVPTFRDFLNNAPPVSETVKFDNGEQCDVKDIRVMFEQFRKQNLSYLELLFTKWKIVDWRYKKLLKPLWENREAIAAINKKQLAKATAGTVMEKRKALCHPYPNLMEKIEKYGYDGKQLSHAVRLYYLLEAWEYGAPLERCFVPNAEQRDRLMNYKKQLDENGVPLDKERAIEFCDEMVRRVGAIKDRIPERIDGRGIKVLDKVKYNVIRRAFKWKLK